MDEHDDIRSLLTQAAADVPAVAPDASRVVRRARRRATGTMAVGALTLVALLAVGTPALRDLLSVERPAILPAITGLEDGAYVVDLRTGRATRLEGLPSDAVEFDPAPGGEQIAFVSARNGSPQVYVMNVDGTGLRRVTDDPFGASGPVWSPDRTRIAYSGFGDGLTRNLFVLDLATGDVRQVTDIRDDAVRPTWAPDGRNVVYVVMRRIHYDQGLGTTVVVARGVDLTTGRDRPLFGGARASVVDVDIASDGRLFVASLIADSPTSYDIRVLEPGSPGPGTLLFAGRSDEYDPKASPDGTRVAFAGFIDDVGTPAVRVVDLEGRPVLGMIRWAHDPSWLSDELLLVDVGCQEHASSGCPA